MREFSNEPRWSKRKLKEISDLTRLSEGQVYKWGWDQKRKKYGIEKAEQMRQDEHKMDQEDNMLRSKQQKDPHESSPVSS